MAETIKFDENENVQYQTQPTSSDCKSGNVLEHVQNVDLAKLLADVKSGVVDIRSKEVQDMLDVMFPEVCPTDSWGFQDKLNAVSSLVYRANKVICTTGKFFYVYHNDTAHRWAYCKPSGFDSLEGTWLYKALIKQLENEKVALERYEHIVKDLKHNLAFVNCNWWIKATFPEVVHDGSPVRCFYYIKHSRQLCYSSLEVNLPLQNKRLFPLLCLVEQVYGNIILICMDLIKIAAVHPGIEAIKEREKASLEDGQPESDSEKDEEKSLMERVQERNQPQESVLEKERFVKVGQTKLPTKAVGESKVVAGKTMQQKPCASKPTTSKSLASTKKK